MRGWPLVLGGLAGAALAAVVLKALPAGIVIVLVLVAVAYASVRFRRISRSAKEGLAAQSLRFERADVDPFGLLALPASLFARGSEQVVSDVMWGTWGGVEVKLFRLSYTEGPGATRVFACGIAEAGSELPATVIEPHAFLVPEADRAELPEVSTDERFDAVFDVRSEDPARVAAMLDEDVRGSLLELEGRWAIELRDRLVLCFSPAEDRDPLERLDVLRTTLRAFGEPARPAAAPGAAAPSHPDAPLA